MLREIISEAVIALGRNRLRSALTMLGIVWGIVAVSILLSYGQGFRGVLLDCFEASGKSLIVAWPGQTSKQAGGQRAGRRIRLETADVELLRAEATLVRHASAESTRWVGVAYGTRVIQSPVRGIEPVYREIRNDNPREGRWITAEDLQDRRAVTVLGGRLAERLFGRRTAIGETVQIEGKRFTVIGVVDRKLSFGNYMGPEEESAYIPYTSAGDLWNNRYLTVIAIDPIASSMEERAIVQVRELLSRRHRFAPDDEQAVELFGKSEIRPIIDGISIGLQVLLTLIGTLTLAIGGVGVMNIMLVSVDERIREIGLRRALGARRWHVRVQMLAEALVITLAGGLLGLIVSPLVAWGAGTMPLMGPLFQDNSGKGDITLSISYSNVVVSMAILAIVGVAAGLVPAFRASRLDPSSALRWE